MLYVVMAFVWDKPFFTSGCFTPTCNKSKGSICFVANHPFPLLDVNTRRDGPHSGRNLFLQEEAEFEGQFLKKNYRKRQVRLVLFLCCTKKNEFLSFAASSNFFGVNC